MKRLSFPPDRSYRFTAESRTVRFNADTLTVFDRARQLGARDPERGGQLFARISAGEAEVVAATEVAAKRSRFSFLPSRRREQDEIDRLFANGLHFIGDWHTHPEDVPTPSSLDTQKICEIYLKSKHELPWFIMVIVGRAPFPQGLYVGVVDANGVSTAHAPSDR